MRNSSDLGPAVRMLIMLNKLFPKPGTPPREYDRNRLADSINPGSGLNYLVWQRHAGRLRRLAYEEHITFEGKTGLDLGCGLGGATLVYAEGARLAIGLDLQTGLLQKVGAYVRDTDGLTMFPATFVCGDASRLPFASNSFEFIVSSDFLEHVDDPESALLEALRVLKEDGCLGVSFPSWRSEKASHLYDYIYIPWCQLFFSSKTLSAAYRELIVRSGHAWLLDGSFRSGTGLNRITRGRFISCLLKAGNCELVKLRYNCHRRWLQPLVYVPILGEVFSDSVECVLRKRTGSAIGSKQIVGQLAKQFSRDLHRLLERMRRQSRMHESLANGGDDAVERPDQN